MGLGFLDPTRLLQKTWASASDLAMELYHQATQESSAKVSRPVEIQKSPGRPALKIDYAPINNPQQQVRTEQIQRPVQRQFADQGLRSVEPTGAAPGVLQPSAGSSISIARSASEVASKAIAPIARAEEARALKESVADPISRFASRVISSAVSGLSSPQPEVSPAGRVAPAFDDSHVRHSESSQFPANRFVSSGDVFDGADIDSRSQSSTRVSGKPQESTWSPGGTRNEQRSKPAGLGELEHADPIVDVSGPVVFRGPDPVQFSAMPQVFDKRSGGYVGLAEAGLQSQWQRWLTIDTKICWCDSEGVTAATMRQPPSTSDLGSGNVYMYQVDQDADQLQPIDDPDGEEGAENKVKAYSLYNFPFKNTFAFAKMLGDHWFVFPFGSAVVAKTRSGGIPSGEAAICDLYSTIGGSKIAAGEGPVFNDANVTVGPDGDITIIAVIDTSGQLRVVMEAC